MQVAVDTTPPPSTATKTRLSGNRLVIARFVWLVILILCVGIHLVSLSSRFELTNNSIAEAEPLLREMGLTTTIYAAYVVTLQGITAVTGVFAGLLIFWRRSNDWMAIFVSLVLIMLGTIAQPVLRDIAEGQPTLLFGVIFIQSLPYGSLPLLVYLFPNGRFVPAWSRWLAPLAVGLPMAAYVGGVLISPFGAIVQASAIGSGFLFQVYRYRRVSGPIERQQTKWVLVGFAWFVMTIFFFIFVSILSPSSQPMTRSFDVILRLGVAPAAGNLVLTLIPLTIAVSLLRFRLWDVDPILNRGLVYGVVTALAVVVLFIMTLLVQVVVGEQQPLVALLLAGILSAFAFNPVRNRVQHLVDRRIYGFRFDLNELHAMHHRPQVENPGALTGVVLNGYEVRGVIGQGGMGEIYQGSGEDETVAIKTMLPSIAADTEMRTRFQREVEAGQRLDHPNIARVYVSGTHNNTPYLIMEYIDGHTIGELLKRDGKFNETDARRILQDIASALETAHQAGLVHRDLKPSNVMLRPDGTAVLMDFGVTKVSDASVALTGTGAVGTITYMAPEQIRSSREVDHRADIYALGVMLYEMVIGEPPFKGNPAQMVFAHLQQPPPDPRDTQPDMPRPVSKAILRALAKDPDDRFQSARDFAAALHY